MRVPLIAFAFRFFNLELFVRIMFAVGRRLRLLALLPLASASLTTRAGDLRNGASAFTGEVVQWSNSAPPPHGCKDVLFVRHAEGFHNKAAVEIEDFFTTDKHQADEWIDARLTPLGIEQSRALARTLSRDPLPDAVVTSPLTRAMQTADIAYPDFREKFIATELSYLCTVAIAGAPFRILRPNLDTALTFRAWKMMQTRCGLSQKRIIPMG